MTKTRIVYCLQRGARGSGCEPAWELTIVIWANVRQTLLTVTIKFCILFYFSQRRFISWFTSKAILQRTFFLPSWYDDFCGWCCAAVTLQVWIQIRRAYPESQLQRLGFVDFERLICKMSYVIVGECLFSSSQPLREVNPSSERALLVPEHPTKERTSVSAVEWRSILPPD